MAGAFFWRMAFFIYCVPSQVAGNRVANTRHRQMSLRRNGSEGRTPLLIRHLYKLIGAKIGGDVAVFAPARQTIVNPPTIEAFFVPFAAKISLPARQVYHP